MADYERRLQRLEDRAAADDSGDLLLEACRKRSAELLSSPEVLSLKLPDMSEEEWAPVREELLAAASLEQGRP